MNFKAFMESKDEYYFTAMADRAMESAMDNAMKEKPLEKDAISDWFMEVLKELKSKISNNTVEELEITLKEDRFFDFVYHLTVLRRNLYPKQEEIDNFLKNIIKIAENNILPYLKEKLFFQSKLKIEKILDNFNKTNVVESLDEISNIIKEFVFSTACYLMNDYSFFQRMARYIDYCKDRKASDIFINAIINKRIEFNCYKPMEKFLDDVWHKIGNTIKDFYIKKDENEF